MDLAAEVQQTSDEEEELRRIEEDRLREETARNDKHRGVRSQTRLSSGDPYVDHTHLRPTSPSLSFTVSANSTIDSNTAIHHQNLRRKPIALGDPVPMNMNHYQQQHQQHQDMMTDMSRNAPKLELHLDTSVKLRPGPGSASTTSTGLSGAGGTASHKSGESVLKAKRRAMREQLLGGGGGSKGVDSNPGGVTNATFGLGGQSMVPQQVGRRGVGGGSGPGPGGDPVGMYGQPPAIPRYPSISTNNTDAQSFGSGSSAHSISVSGQSSTSRKERLKRLAALRVTQSTIGEESEYGGSGISSRGIGEEVDEDDRQRRRQEMGMGDGGLGLADELGDALSSDDMLDAGEFLIDVTEAEFIAMLAANEGKRRAGPRSMGKDYIGHGGTKEKLQPPIKEKKPGMFSSKLRRKGENSEGGSIHSNGSGSIRSTPSFSNGNPAVSGRSESGTEKKIPVSILKRPGPGVPPPSISMSGMNLGPPVNHHGSTLNRNPSDSSANSDKSREQQEKRFGAALGFFGNGSHGNNGRSGKFEDKMASTASLIPASPKKIKPEPPSPRNAERPKNARSLDLDLLSAIEAMSDHADETGRNAEPENTINVDAVKDAQRILQMRGHQVSFTASMSSGSGTDTNSPKREMTFPGSTTAPPGPRIRVFVNSETSGTEGSAEIDVLKPSSKAFKFSLIDPFPCKVGQLLDFVIHSSSGDVLVKAHMSAGSMKIRTETIAGMTQSWTRSLFILTLQKTHAGGDTKSQAGQPLRHLQANLHVFPFDIQDAGFKFKVKGDKAGPVAFPAPSRLEMVRMNVSSDTTLMAGTSDGSTKVLALGTRGGNSGGDLWLQLGSDVERSEWVLQLQTVIAELSMETTPVDQSQESWQQPTTRVARRNSVPIRKSIVPPSQEALDTVPPTGPTGRPVYQKLPSSSRSLTKRHSISSIASKDCSFVDFAGKPSIATMSLMSEETTESGWTMFEGGSIAGSGGPMPLIKSRGLGSTIGISPPLGHAILVDPTNVTARVRPTITIPGTTGSPFASSTKVPISAVQQRQRRPEPKSGISANGSSGDDTVHPFPTPLAIQPSNAQNASSQASPASPNSLGSGKSPQLSYTDPSNGKTYEIPPSMLEAFLANENLRSMLTKPSSATASSRDGSISNLTPTDSRRSSSTTDTPISSRKTADGSLVGLGIASAIGSSKGVMKFNNHDEDVNIITSPGSMTTGTTTPSPRSRMASGNSDRFSYDDGGIERLDTPCSLYPQLNQRGTVSGGRGNVKSSGGDTGGGDTTSQKSGGSNGSGGAARKKRGELRERMKRMKAVVDGPLDIMAEAETNDPWEEADDTLLISPNSSMGGHYHSTNSVQLGGGGFDGADGKMGGGTGSNRNPTVRFA